jgi:hypothetical protein|tara:strand:- start:114 stop:548 length:435 start_codon:yes stop_codon:yes gene_type:complete
MLDFSKIGVKMLGEKMGHASGPTQIKIMPAINGAPQFETTANATGTFLGVEVQCMSTYSSELKADGSLYGECPNSGLLMASDGVATFRATACGRMTEDGGAAFKGVAYFTTSAPSLSGLNGKALVFDWTTAADGTATWDLWEWA